MDEDSTVRQLQQADTPGDLYGASSTNETLEQKKATSWTPMGQERDKSPASINQIVSFMFGQS